MRTVRCLSIATVFAISFGAALPATLAAEPELWAYVARDARISRRSIIKWTRADREEELQQFITNTSPIQRYGASSFRRDATTHELYRQQLRQRKLDQILGEATRTEPRERNFAVPRREIRMRPLSLRERNIMDVPNFHNLVRTDGGSRRSQRRARTRAADAVNSGSHVAKCLRLPLRDRGLCLQGRTDSVGPSSLTRIDRTYDDCRALSGTRAARCRLQLQGLEAPES